MSLIQTIVKKSNTCIYIPNQLFPFLCVFIIAKTPTILLVGFVLGYIMIQPSNHLLIENNDDSIALIEAPVNKNNQDQTNSLDDSKQEEDRILDLILLENNILKKPLLLEDSNALANSIEFENLMKFPSCPTTLPRLDTHFNFIIDHDIKSPDSSDIDWSAISQEMEYEQQRQDVANNCTKSEENQKVIVEQQPILILQENLSSIFPSEQNHLIPLQNPTKELSGIAAHIPFGTDPAILIVENEPDTKSPLSMDIENLLLLPYPPSPLKPSLSSPGQLFKSKFQKAVKKMKKSSNLLRNEELNYKRSSTFSHTNNKKAASLQLNQNDWSVPLSPRPSASARVHDHFKGRLNKLFRK